jgi:hypothetical protein
VDDLEALADAVREAARARPEEPEEAALTAPRRSHLRMVRTPVD